jgi:hypothetical protein
METNLPASTVAKRTQWIGHIMGLLPVLMLVASAIMKFAKPAAVVEGFAHLGWSEGSAFGLGILELACTVVYLIPGTAVLGAILLTGYLGGAIATTLRVGDSYIPTAVMGVMLWGGLFLREPRLRALLPMRK